MNRSKALILCAALACTSLASAQDYTVIHSNVSGLPNALVPGMGGLEFKPGFTSNSAFDGLYRSPNGNWIMTALMDTGGIFDDEVIMVNGVVMLREGDPAPYDAGNNHGSIDTKVGINDAGQFVFATNVAPSGTNDDYIVRGDGLGGYTVIAREGDAIPALPGNTYDDSLDTPVLMDDGTVGFCADGVDGTVISTTDDLLILGTTLLQQEGVTVPPGQFGAEFIENFDEGDTFVSGDGLHWICQGDLTGPTTEDDIVLVDGTVVLQEGITIIPGTDGNVIDGAGIKGVYMDPGGNWYARGDNDVNEFCWVLRNNVLIAKTGDPIITGSTEVWGETFHTNTGNAVGDYLVGGNVDSGSYPDHVLVLNGTEIIARQGDPIDLDGNGLFDDDTFLFLIGYDDAILLDNGTVRFPVSLVDGAGTAYAAALLEVQRETTGVGYCFGDSGSGTPCPCGNDNDGTVPGAGCANGQYTSGALLTGTGTASLTSDTLVLIGEHTENNQSGLYFQADNDLSPGNVWGDGLQCAGGQLIRLGVRFSDGTGYSDTSAWTTPISVKAGNVMAGDIKYYQLWYRNPLGTPCGSEFNASNGYAVTWLP